MLFQLTYYDEVQRTNFKKLLEEESAKLKGTSSAPENHPFMRQFREAIWVCFLGIVKEKGSTIFSWMFGYPRENHYADNFLV